MKRKHLLLHIFGVLLMSVFFLLTNKTVFGSDNVSLEQPENYTLQVYGDMYGDASDEEIDKFFNFPDEQVIIADESGSFVTTLDNSAEGYTEICEEDGTLIRRIHFLDKKYAATIGEIKDYLKSIN